MPAAGEIGSALAGFFLDPAAKWPAELEFSAWVYPYSRQVSIRGAMMMKFGLSGNVHFSLLKFYPLAFLITRGDISAAGPSIQSILEGTRELDDLGHFSVERGNFAHFAWPESPEEDGMILMGEGAVVALPRSPFESTR
ncbi:hypothetical protein [Arenimonas terrae]|uniref:Uncharacterized protein n=1 Tax=Arenimonas terrae TaxID=2546226 RepID=A0A5C4RTY5_9GAMM|nr:hypothetical protein [Arenimonas terrae]TNJ34425.1 hypothetical protein E1B00_01150 [Arenimonas terrae]